MSLRTLQLVLHYDGTRFSGWQRQPDRRTVQGCLEQTLERLCNQPVAVLGAGRTDAGVHARGQTAGIRVHHRWEAGEMRRALNALLPDDLWVALIHEMKPEFHARHDATSRRYRYQVGLDDQAASPFRRRWEWAVRRELRLELLNRAAEPLLGTHAFHGYAVRGTAPPDDQHLCTVAHAAWDERNGGVDFTIEANRFLHHMVRFLVGTMVDVAAGKRPLSDISKLLRARDNSEVSPPAPSHALYLEQVTYPEHLYITSAK